MKIKSVYTILLNVILLLILNLNFENSKAQTYFLENYFDASASQLYSAQRVREVNGNLFLNYTVFPTAVNDGAILKTDTNGSNRFTKHYSAGPTINSVHVTFRGMDSGVDSSLLITGEYWTTIPGVFQGFIMKVREDGSVFWCKSPTSGFNRYYEDVVRTTDDNMVVRAFVYNSVYETHLLKLNQNGQLLSSKILSDTSNSLLLTKSMTATSTNGLLVGGNTSNAFLCRLDSLFNVTAGTEFPDFSTIADAHESSDGGAIALLSTLPNGVSNSLQFIKTDANLQVTHSTFFSNNAVIMYGKKVIENSDHTYYCLINWEPLSNPTGVVYGMIAHLDSSGVFMDVKDSLDIRSFDDIIVTQNNRYCSMITYGDGGNFRPAILMTDSAFSQLNTNLYCLEGKPTAIPIFTASTVQSPYSPYVRDSSISLTFASIFEFGGTNIPGNCLLSSIDEQETGFNIFPNPFNNQFTISFDQFEQIPKTISIRNMLGQSILFQSIEQTQTSATLLLKNSSPGIYLLELDYGFRKVVRKICQE